MTEPATYELVLRGRVSARLLHPLLDDFTVEHGSPGVTRLVGRVTDPSHLHGVLAHLTSVGVQVISLGPAAPTARPATSTPHRHHSSTGARS